MTKNAIWTTVVIAGIIVAIAVFFYLKEYKTELEIEQQNLRELEEEVRSISDIPNLIAP